MQGDAWQHKQFNDSADSERCAAKDKQRFGEAESGWKVDSLKGRSRADFIEDNPAVGKLVQLPHGKPR